VSRGTLTWLGCRFDPCHAPSLNSADPFDLISRSMVERGTPDIVSELACVHQSIFEHAEIDCRIEQSVRCVGAEVPFNVWSVDATHLPGELDCRPFFRPLTPEIAGSRPFFARPFGSEMGARETASQAAFLSLRMTMKSSEGGGGNA
jgi:hypothetical protein